MASKNPSYFQRAPVSQEIKQEQLLFDLYMYQHLEGSQNGNQKIIKNPNLAQSFGCLVANDWAIYDGLVPNGNLVARAQGLHLGASMTKENWFICINIVFIDERFKGSSLKVIGDFQTAEGEFAIVGGTGEFTHAQGAVTFKKIQELDQGNIRELHIRALCLTFPKPAPANKIGPLGGDGGTYFGIRGAPQRLESVTIRSDDVINSIAFSYIDQVGQKRTAGPWGGDRGRTDTISLAPSEIVKNVIGTTGKFSKYTVVTSLIIVTNVRMYGPYGKAPGTSFRLPVKDDENIVGFFARTGGNVDALGAYVRHD